MKTANRDHVEKWPIFKNKNVPHQTWWKVSSLWKHADFTCIFRFTVTGWPCSSGPSTCQSGQGLALSGASLFHGMAVRLIWKWRLSAHNLSSNLPDSRLSIPCVSDISMKHSLSSYSRQKPGNCVCHSVTHSPLGVLEPIHKYAPRPVSHLLHWHPHLTWSFPGHCLLAFTPRAPSGHSPNCSCWDH